MSGNILLRVALSLPISFLLASCMCGYGNVIFISASGLHLHKLDEVQRAAEKLSDNIVVLSQGQCNWSTVKAAGFLLPATTPDFLPQPSLCCVLLMTTLKIHNLC